MSLLRGVPSEELNAVIIRGCTVMSATRDSINHKTVSEKKKHIEENKTEYTGIMKMWGNANKCEGHTNTLFTLLSFLFLFVWYI